MILHFYQKSLWSSIGSSGWKPGLNYWTYCGQSDLLCMIRGFWLIAMPLGRYIAGRRWLRGRTRTWGRQKIECWWDLNRTDRCSRAFYFGLHDSVHEWRDEQCKCWECEVLFKRLQCGYFQRDLLDVRGDELMESALEFPFGVSSKCEQRCLQGRQSR